LGAIVIGVAFSSLLYLDISLSDKAHQRELDAVNRRFDESARALTDTGRKLDQSNQRLEHLTALVQEYAASVAPQDEAALMAAIRQAFGDAQVRSAASQEQAASLITPANISSPTTRETTSETTAVEIAPAVAFPSDDVPALPISNVNQRPAPPSNLTLILQ
jgi:hypothetical protein